MPTNPYTSQSISGFNTSPPPDDGSRSAANKLEWAKHVTKLATPLKTLIEGVNAAVLSAFGSLVMTTDPAENTVVLAMEEFTAPEVTRVPRASKANKAADLSAFSENVVVAMEEFVA